jgi:Flagellar protein YcgR/PilZ domain
MTTAIEEQPADSAVAAEKPASAARKAQYRFQDMRLKVGDRVQIEPPSQTGIGRLSCKVVGWVEGQSLILTVPHTPAGRFCLHAGENVVVRVFTGRSAYAFGCTVLSNCIKANDYLHLSFPGVIDGVDVRSSPRFRVALPAMAGSAAASERVQATIDNIGSTGALLVCADRLGEVGDSLEVAFDIVLHDVPVSLALRAQIRTVEEGSDQQHRHGVSFSEPTPNDRLVLAALVWFNMYENPKLST